MVGGAPQRSAVGPVVFNASVGGMDSGTSAASAGLTRSSVGWTRRREGMPSRGTELGPWEPPEIQHGPG